LLGCCVHIDDLWRTDRLVEMAEMAEMVEMAEMAEWQNGKQNLHKLTVL
jgi:hypothetical protein